MTRPWYLMTRYSVSRGSELRFESSHATRDSCRAKAERLLTAPLASGHRGVVAAAVWFRPYDSAPDPRTDTQKTADQLMRRAGWDR